MRLGIEIGNGYCNTGRELMIEILMPLPPPPPLPHPPSLPHHDRKDKVIQSDQKKSYRLFSLRTNL